MPYWMPSESDSDSESHGELDSSSEDRSNEIEDRPIHWTFQEGAHPAHYLSFGQMDQLVDHAAARNEDFLNACGRIEAHYNTLQ